MKKKYKIVLLVILIIIIVISALILLIKFTISKNKVVAVSGEVIEESKIENEKEDMWRIQDVSSMEKDKEKDNKNKSVIYLTFDDGPSSITSRILDVLKEEGVNATFFIINYEEKQEDVVRRIVNEGNAIGIHGYSHEYKKIYKSEKAYMKNINKLQLKIKETTGVTTTITRFPGGSSNTISNFNKGIMTKLTKLVEKEGFKYYDWNVDSDDAGSARNEKDIYKNVKAGLVKERANVVLMHDAGSKTKTLNALKSIIEYGKKKGYTFKTISADSDLKMHHKVFN